MSDATSADYEVANALAEQAATFIRCMVAFASECGTRVTISQIIGTFLAVSISLVEEPVTRDDFMRIYDVFEQQFSGALAVAQAARDFGSGPEATADAPDKDAADRMTSHWGQKVLDATFDMDLAVSPEALAEWERELLAGDTDG